MNAATGTARLMRPAVVYGWLAVLTAFELAVVRVPLGRGATASLLVGSALAKAALVVLHFMHLRIEGRILRAIALLPLLLVVAFVVALIPDIGARR
ncbi:MAG: cytochrome C oxidase subunit IV family protein [Planctomycetes bacterium]|nr:cytochrome C oxidase subunit IV family protein [Planctomycetota bacterium]